MHASPKSRCELKSERPNFVRPRVRSAAAAAAAHDNVAAAPDAAAAASAAAPPISYNVLSASYGACARCHVPLPLGGPMEDHVPARRPPYRSWTLQFLHSLTGSTPPLRSPGGRVTQCSRQPMVAGSTLSKQLLQDRLSGGIHSGAAAALAPAGVTGAYGVRAAVWAPPAAAPAGLWNC